METTVGDFFKATTYTSREHGYTAPELVLEFRVRMVDVTPDGDKIAFGYAKAENESKWTPTGFGIAEWSRYNWTIKPNEGDSN